MPIMKQRYVKSGWHRVKAAFLRLFFKRAEHTSQQASGYTITLQSPEYLEKISSDGHLTEQASGKVSATIFVQKIYADRELLNKMTDDLLNKLKRDSS